MGSFVLGMTIIITALYIHWALEPLNYKKAFVLEKKAHQYFRKKQYHEAYGYFLKAAHIEDINTTRSVRYRCVGTSLEKQKKYKEAITYYKKALQYDHNNKHAKESINKLYKLQNKKIATKQEDHSE